MELRHLRYYVAIAEERSFTRAAERLWIAQPGLSTQIRRLEAELRLKLFERHTRGVDLTPAGELFLERARAVLAAAEAAQAVGEDLHDGLAGLLRVGIATGTGWRLAPELLERFGQDRPAVELSVIETHGGALLRDLRDGRLDAVLAPASFGSAEFFSARLGSEPWLVLAARSHPLGAVDAPVDRHELEGEHVIVTGHRDGLAYDRAVTELLADLGVTMELRRGGAGPALFAGVGSGEAIALITSPKDVLDGMTARPLNPARCAAFALLWSSATPAPVLTAFVDAAQALAVPASTALRAVA